MAFDVCSISQSLFYILHKIGECPFQDMTNIP
jgi:hypothetical protein